jgi:quercetin dioxygenase-like cupin family protein
MTRNSAGLIRAGEKINNISWNIVGQTYLPKMLSAECFSWHATFPPGTFVPPHSHSTQDEYVYILEGEMTFWLDGEEFKAGPGDLARLPRQRPHGIFNKSAASVRCLFWVTPTGRLFDLFEAIHDLADPAQVVAVAEKHEVHFLPE